MRNINSQAVYFTLIEAHPRYGISSWGETISTNMERDFLHQKKARRCLVDVGFQ